MSNYIIEYAGAPVRFPDDGSAIELVREEIATPFASEGEALACARDARLNLDRCKVVNLYLRNQAPIPVPRA